MKTTFQCHTINPSQHKHPWELPSHGQTNNWCQKQPKRIYSLECLVIFLLFKEIHFLAISHLWPFYINWTLVVWHNSILVFILQIWHEIYVQEELQIIQTSSTGFLWSHMFWIEEVDFHLLVCIPWVGDDSTCPIFIWH